MTSKKTTFISLKTEKKYEDGNRKGEQIIQNKPTGNELIYKQVKPAHNKIVVPDRILKKAKNKTWSGN